MSGWDAYINALRGDGSVINGAAIYGQGPAPQLWAASSAQFLKPEEIAAIAKGSTDQATFDQQAATGIYVGGEKYMKVASDFSGKVLRGKKGDQAVSSAFSKRAIVVARGKGSPQEVSAAVEKMANDLASKGF